MTITQVISTLPTAPARSQAPATFIANSDAHVAAQATLVSELNTWTTQANAMAAGMSAIATGAALSIPLTFSTTTTDSDPGNGIVRLDNATQNAATTIRTDLIGNDGSTWTDVINLFDDSTSTIKGFITLVDVTDATKWLVFSVSAVASPAGYKNITVACVASSTANPFADGASLALKFTRNGDKGNTGATGTGITEQATGFTATGGTTPKTLTVDENVTASLLAQVAASQAEMEAGTEAALRTMSPLRVKQAIAALQATGGDASANIGYLNIPQNSQSAAYTLVLGDAGKHVLHPSADTTARTFTIPANSSVEFPVGTAITFVNQASAGVMTIAITTDTMRLAGAGTTGSRTLAANGVATAIKVTATEWIINGTGLT